MFQPLHEQLTDSTGRCVYENSVTCRNLAILVHEVLRSDRLKQ